MLHRMYAHFIEAKNDCKLLYKLTLNSAQALVLYILVYDI